MHSWEPLLQFVLIGIAVFALYQAGSPLEPASAQRVIEVTPAQVERLAGQFEAGVAAAAIRGGADGLVEDFVREEVYYREALALGLDRDDTVIPGGAAEDGVPKRCRRRGDGAGRRRTAGAFRGTRRSVHTGGAGHVPAGVSGRGGPRAGVGGAGGGSRSKYVGARHSAAAGNRSGHREIGRRIFGDGFFAASRCWRQGPGGTGCVRFRATSGSAREVDPAAPPSFETVRSEVEEDWRRQYAEDVREAQYRALRERYEVVLPTAQVP